MRTCKTCGHTGEDSEFVKGENTCKPCNNEKRKKKYAEDNEYREKLKANQRETNAKLKDKPKPEGEKECTCCGETKDASEFRPNRGECLDCERKNGREYRQGEVGKEKAKQWVEDNKDQMTKLQAEWYQDNKKKINEKYVERYHSDKAFKFKVLQRARISSALCGKSKHTDEYLECTNAFFAEWMKFWCERENDDDFTLETHGKIWEVDHVIPCATFDLEDEDEQLTCFNWRNTMPLKAEINNSKHAKIDKDQIKKHWKNLEKFHKLKKLEIPKKFKELYAKHLKTTGSPLESKLPIKK